MGNIVLDFWGTLAYLSPGPDFGEEIAKLMRLEKKDFHEFVTKYWFRREMSPREFAELLIAKTNSCARIEDIVHWIESPLERARLYEDVAISLDKLNHHNRLYLISDTSTVGRTIINNLGIRRYFQQAVLSCEMGIMKSDGLYDRFFRAANLDMKDTLVVGNSPVLDYDIPVKLGASAILIDREGRLIEYKTIHSLEELE